MEIEDDLEEDDDDKNGDRPRPTYSYRDAMIARPMLHHHGKKKTKHDVILKELLPRVMVAAPPPPPSRVAAAPPPLPPSRVAAAPPPPSRVVVKSKETEKRPELVSSSGTLKPPNNVEGAVVAKVFTEEPLITQSYKLVLKRDSAEQCGYNMLPVEGATTTADLVDHEVKELRIKARVSLGPKRKRVIVNQRPPPPAIKEDLIMAPCDVTNDGLVNEQLANLTPPNQTQTNLPEDPNLFDKPSSNSKGKSSSEPYIVFELTSEDGFKVESRHMSEVWQTVFDAVTSARASLKLCQNKDTARSGVALGGASSSSMSGLHMLGLTHNAVQYLLEQLPGSNDCQKYSFQVSNLAYAISNIYIYIYTYIYRDI